MKITCTYNFKTTTIYSIALFLGLCVLVSCTSKQKTGLPKDLMVSEHITKEAIAKSWNLLQQGQQMAEQGKSIAEILKILPDSTLVQTNANTLLFHIKGSVPMLVELPNNNSKNKKKYKGGGSRAIPLNMRSSYLTATYTSTLFNEGSENVNILAYEKGEDKRQQKKALILSPFINDFGNYDDGILAKKKLEKNKNYNGNVVFKSKNLTLKDFQNFGDYDLVHISTHGIRFCDPVSFANGGIEIVSGGDSNYCRTLIDTGIKHGLDTDVEINTFLSENPELRNLIVIADEQISLRSSFFDYYYSNKDLSDKIWVFSACELGQRSDLATSINNILSNSHFFYWLNTVDAEDAIKTFDVFYKNLITEGLDAQKSFEEIPDNLRNNLPSEYNDSIETSTELIHLQTGSSRHGIEIIEMWHPEDKKPITQDVFYPVVGDFGDGVDETLTLKLQLKGYTKAEFEAQQMTISLKVDDNIVLSKQSFLPSSESTIEVKDLEKHKYGVEVTINDIPIPDVGEKTKITLTTYLHLNEENFSVHKERVTIKSDGVKATMTGSGNTMVLTFDDKRRAQKIESAQMPSDAYTDDSGYMYISTPKQGWVKMHVGKFMGNAMPMAPIPTNPALNKMVSSSGTNSGIFFPITQWGLQFRKVAFENNTNFKKQLVNCDKAEKCTKFIGIAGQESGVTALFSPGGRLKELNFNGVKITYEYGDYTVILPEAKEISLGI